MIDPHPGDENRPVVYWSRKGDDVDCEDGRIVRWNETSAMVQFDLGFPIPVNLKHLEWSK